MASRIAWRGSPKDMALKIEGLPDELIAIAADIMEDVVQEGADEMRDNIRNGATDKVRAGQWTKARPGRIDSGDMLNDVKSEVKRFRRSVKGTFGWGVGGGTVNPYYSYQENGFQHWVSGDDIKPMHALLDAFMATREKFFRRMREEVRSMR